MLNTAEPNGQSHRQVLEKLKTDFGYIVFLHSLLLSVSTRKPPFTKETQRDRGGGGASSGAPLEFLQMALSEVKNCNSLNHTVFLRLLTNFYHIYTDIISKYI